MEEENSIESKDLSLDRIQKLISEFRQNPKIKKLKDLYTDKSFLDILLAGRRELSHSSFLAWLFNNEECHQLGDFSLKKLLEIILKRNEDQNEDQETIKITPKLREAIVTDQIKFKKIKIKTESTTKIKKNRSGRADILIEAKVKINECDTETIRIVIENKVDSTEHDGQTEIYFEYFDKIKKDYEENIYIYLTPMSSFELNGLSKAICDSGNFIQINYQDILDDILEPVLDKNDISDRTRFIITEYIKSLNHPSLDDNSNKKTTIMAITKAEKDSINSFWEENRELIIAIMGAIDYGDDPDPEVIEETKKVISLLKARDQSKYSLNEKGSYGKRPIVRETIMEYLNKNPKLSVSELIEIFPDKLIPTYGVIRDKKEAMKRKKCYTKIKPGIYVCNQLKIDHMTSFIDHVNNKVEGIIIDKL